VAVCDLGGVYDCESPEKSQVWGGEKDRGAKRTGGGGIGKEGGIADARADHGKKTKRFHAQAFWWGC